MIKIIAFMSTVVACVALAGCDAEPKKRRSPPDPILDKDRYIDYEFPDRDSSWPRDTRYHVSFDSTGQVVMVDHVEPPRHMLFYHIEQESWSTTSPLPWDQPLDPFVWGRIKWERLGLPRLHGPARVYVDSEHPDALLFLQTRCLFWRQRESCNEALWRNKSVYHIYDWNERDGLQPLFGHIPNEVGFEPRHKRFAWVEGGYLRLSVPYLHGLSPAMIRMPERVDQNGHPIP